MRLRVPILATYRNLIHNCFLMLPKWAMILPLFHCFLNSNRL